MKSKLLAIILAMALVLMLPMSALAVSKNNGFSSGVKVAAKKAVKKKVVKKKTKKVKKAKKAKVKKSENAGTPSENQAGDTSETPATEPAAAAPAPEGVSEHAVDFTLKCPGKDIVLQFVDNEERVKDSVFGLYDKRTDCVELFLSDWEKQARASKVFPMDLMKKLFGVPPTPKETADTKSSNGEYRLWKYYLSGDRVLGALGDKFAPADEAIRLDGAKCYAASLLDYRGRKDKTSPQWMLNSWSAIYAGATPPDCIPKE